MTKSSKSFRGTGWPETSGALGQEEAEGQSFLNLDIGLPVDQLKGVIRSCLNGQSGSEELALHATNRKGKPIECRVAYSPLAGSRNESECEGVILMMEEREG